MKIKSVNSQIHIESVLPQNLNKSLSKVYLKHTSLKSDLKLDILFKKDCCKNNVIDAFMLKNIDRILDPNIFEQNIKNIYFLLQDYLSDDLIKDFVQKDLDVLLLNKEIFNKYSSMLISG